MKKIVVFFILLILIFSTIGVNAEEAYIYDFYYEDGFYSYAGTATNVVLKWENNAIHMVTLNGPSDGGTGDPFFYLMCDQFDADTYYWAKIRIKNNSNASYFQMHFDTGSGITGESNTLVPISKGDEDYKEYVFNIKERNLATSEYTQTTDYPFTITESVWTGSISNIRLDCMFEAFRGGQIETGSEFDLEYIGFFKSEEEANNFNPDRSATPTPKPTAAPTPTPTPKPEATATATVKPTATAKPSTSGDDKADFPFAILGIALGVVVLVIVVIFIFAKKKKK